MASMACVQMLAVPAHLPVREPQRLVQSLAVVVATVRVARRRPPAAFVVRAGRREGAEVRE